MKKKILALAVALSLGGCANFTLVNPGKVDIGGKVEVEADTKWSAAPVEEGSTWTIDGPGLQQLIFHLGVEDGKTLFSQIDIEPRKLFGVQIEKRDAVSFKFAKTMTEPELMELFSASLTKLLELPVETANLAPANLGGHPGFRFDYRMVGNDEVKRRGKVVGAVVDGKLYMVNYIGTDLYHFSKGEPHADHIISTLKFKKG
ncbi:MAG TPA: hypothetical protein VLL76_03070 [Candidatus Omnitrophota bacterium]|nr:hypothetical protein [Candidatus Omnitrophota bacterium]